MAWADARARIAELLETVSITSPITESIVKAYETPPGTVQDLPCFIIFPPALTVERGSGGLRIKTYTVRLELLVRDADLSQAADLVDAYREATIDVFDTKGTLSGTCTLIVGPRVEEASGLEYPRGTGSFYTGFDAFLTVQIQEPKAFT